MLTLDPPRELLIKGPLGTPGPATVKLVLHNRSSTDRIGFKMKTLDPSRYVVRPSKGFIGPANCVTVRIRCKPVRDLAAFNMNKQKFMVQSLIAHTSEDTLADLFPMPREMSFILTRSNAFLSALQPLKTLRRLSMNFSVQNQFKMFKVSSRSFLTLQASVKDTAAKQEPLSSSVKSSTTEPTAQSIPENLNQTKEELKDSSVQGNETLELIPKQEEAKFTSALDLELTSTKSSSKPLGGGETSSIAGSSTDHTAAPSAPNCSSEPGPVICLQSSLLTRRNVIIATAAIRGIVLFVLIWHKYRR